MELKSIRKEMILRFRVQPNRDNLTKLLKYKKFKEGELRRKQNDKWKFHAIGTV